MWILMGVLPHSWPVQKWGASFEGNWKKKSLLEKESVRMGCRSFCSMECLQNETWWDTDLWIYVQPHKKLLFARSQINSDTCHQRGANYVANSFAVEFVSKVCKAFHLISRSLPRNVSESSKILHPDLLVSCLTVLVRTGSSSFVGLGDAYAEYKTPWNNSYFDIDSLYWKTENGIDPKRALILEISNNVLFMKYLPCQDSCVSCFFSTV